MDIWSNIFAYTFQNTVNFNFYFTSHCQIGQKEAHQIQQICHIYSISDIYIWGCICTYVLHMKHVHWKCIPKQSSIETYTQRQKITVSIGWIWQAKSTKSQNEVKWTKCIIQNQHKALQTKTKKKIPNLSWKICPWDLSDLAKCHKRCKCHIWGDIVIEKSKAY